MKNIVEVKITELAGPSKRGFLPAIVREQFDNSYAGIAFSVEQASLILEKVDVTGVICIDIPRAEYCLSIAEAFDFYERGKTFTEAKVIT